MTKTFNDLALYVSDPGDGSLRVYRDLPALRVGDIYSETLHVNAKRMTLHAFLQRHGGARWAIANCLAWMEAEDRMARWQTRHETTGHSTRDAEAYAMMEAGEYVMSRTMTLDALPLGELHRLLAIALAAGVPA